MEKFPRSASSKQDDVSRLQRLPAPLSDFRSKSVAWKEPMQYLQKIGSSRVPSFFQNKAGRSYRQQPRSSSQRKEFLTDRGGRKPSAWGRLLRKLGMDGGKKIHAARPDWLNYDSQSYAMNFEKDRETQYSSNFQQMPRITGPGAREIVTVLLQRSSSANRNSGSILIPKPVPNHATKPSGSVPLWKRRRSIEPSSLDLHKFRSSNGGRARRSIAR